MAKFEELKKYLNHEFSSVPYTGEDYKKFQNKSATGNIVFK